MINLLEAIENRLMPTPSTGPALNKGRTVHRNPENNRATPGDNRSSIGIIQLTGNYPI